ncbi:hypothetical protein AVEN_7571-1 [Araneus ventricosus]|uniref:Uncharacterized protein n=1 Tax=Araneus ventricosus TaxID=182803 RepID=A0A4Y2IRH4_ARAVE|nr:hypothetical protein AVEN_7571-1 [Araneus ventricosus]
MANSMRSVYRFKLLFNGLSFHEFRPRFALYPAFGMERIDVARRLWTVRKQIYIEESEELVVLENVNNQCEAKEEK